MCDAMYKGNTQQTFKKLMDGHFSDVQRILKNGKIHAHSLPIISNTLNMLRHELNYISVWSSNLLNRSTKLDQ